MHLFWLGMLYLKSRMQFFADKNKNKNVMGKHYKIMIGRRRLALVKDDSNIFW